jgi:hypothetical protein
VLPQRSAPLTISLRPSDLHDSRSAVPRLKPRRVLAEGASDGRPRADVAESPPAAGPSPDSNRQLSPYKSTAARRNAQMQRKRVGVKRTPSRHTSGYADDTRPGPPSPTK